MEPAKIEDMQCEESNVMKTTKMKQIKYKIESYWCCGRLKELTVTTIALLALFIALIAFILSCYNLHLLTSKLAQLEKEISPMLPRKPAAKSSALKSEVASVVKPTKIVDHLTSEKITTTAATSTVASSSTTAAPVMTASSDATTMKMLTTTAETLPDAGTGVVYTRWGRDTCGSDADLIYSGFTAGSASASSSLPGGGLNYLCLPYSPEYNKWDKRGDHMASSWVFAAKLLSFNIGIFNRTYHGEIPKCSVCHSPRSAKVMIPAQRNCPSGWTKEYEGYIMSSSSSHKKSTFECFDETPEVLTETSDGEEGFGGARLYFASGSCNPTNSGRLPICPPYRGAKELTCVICTK